MKIVKYDKQKHEDEKQARERAVLEERKRIEYIEGLRKNKHFRKYVIEGIIRANLEKLTDNKRIVEGLKENTTEEEIGKVVMVSIKARQVLEKILSELTN